MSTGNLPSVGVTLCQFSTQTIRGLLLGSAARQVYGYILRWHWAAVFASSIAFQADNHSLLFSTCPRAAVLNNFHKAVIQCVN